MDSLSRFVVLVARPCAGKTTYALSDAFKGFQYVDPSAFSPADLQDHLDWLVHHQHDIIIDGCNATVEERKAYIQHAKSYPDQNGQPRYNIECHYIEATFADVKRNAVKRESMGGERLNHFDTLRFSKMFELPSKAEGFDVILHYPFIFNSMNAFCNRAIFFSLDGVARVTSGQYKYPISVNEVHMIPKFREYIASFAGKNYKFIAITNQPGVAVGHLTLRMMQKCLIKTIVELPVSVDDILYCPHEEKDQCPCRFPSPFLVNLAKAKFELNLEKCILIGANDLDRSLAKNAGIGSYVSFDDIRNNVVFDSDINNAQLDYACERMFQ